MNEGERPRRPCKKGRKGPRQVNKLKGCVRMGMSEAAKEARRLYMKEYLREWKRKNPEKVKEHNERYWERKAKQAEKATGQAKTIFPRP